MAEGRHGGFWGAANRNQAIYWGYIGNYQDTDYTDTETRLPLANWEGGLGAFARLPANTRIYDRSIFIGLLKLCVLSSKVLQICGGNC